MPTISCSMILGLAILFSSITLNAAEPQASPAEASPPIAAPMVLKTAKSGRWSETSTWTDGRVPGSGDTVYVAPEHKILYDIVSSEIVRSLHLDGTLQFAPDCDTRLEVGLIRVGAGGTTDEQGFDCTVAPEHTAHHTSNPHNAPRAELLIGLPEHPIDVGHKALIRLHYIDGMDPQSCPSIVCCGGRMEFHGAPLSRTWLKLNTTASANARQITLQDEVRGWNVGDQILLTATTRQNKVKKTFRPSTRDSTQTEERIITAITGGTLTLDKPLEFEHSAAGEFRGDVANLSRNVIVESATPDGVRGHTMFHVDSKGSISYAEFRHLGKPGVLGRYSLHFHLAGDSMRGASVIGASIRDSGNRWITVHGTNYLVVRDCVGYQSLGHGFFLEDGTEVYNVFDRNLAVQAYSTKPLPNQVLPYDKNDGSGFWWANSQNTWTRNTAAECDEYGYFFQATKTDTFDPVLQVRDAGGLPRPIDIRTLPFVRFDDNEAHCQRRHSFNLGGGVPFGPPHVAGVGPDSHHPFVISRLKLWNVHWGIHPVSPSVLLDGLTVHDAEYGVWRPEYNQHAYRNVRLELVPDKNHYAFTSTNRPPNDEAHYPLPLEPTDDQPPATVITRMARNTNGTLLLQGTTSDNGEVKEVLINGNPARALRDNFAEWEVTLTADAAAQEVVAQSVDAAGNKEQTQHRADVPSATP